MNLGWIKTKLNF